MSKGQIVNYVNNGGFEDCINCGQWINTVPKYWNATDTGKFFGANLTEDPPSPSAPNSSYTYQWPRHGKGFLITTLFYPSCTSQTASCVGYPRNRLKQFLQAGKIYCLTMYVNLSNESTHAINSIGAYFADNTTDTIKYCMIPITYLTPQIVNSSGFLSDTLNWMKISGTYTANGTEKYIMLGNFNSSANTNTLFVNPKWSPAAFADYSFDDVSLIETDLPAFAGRDTFFIPGDSIYLGRPSDVGIDEDCMWYKLPNTSQAVDTIAGFWLKPTTTCTYVVKQDICGNIKYDTIVLYQSAIGINEINLYSDNLKIYPQPAQNSLTIQINLQMDDNFNHLFIFNHLGQMIREEEITFIHNKVSVNISGLADGVYSLQLLNSKNISVTKRIVVTK